MEMWTPLPACERLENWFSRQVPRRRFVRSFRTLSEYRLTRSFCVQGIKSASLYVFPRIDEHKVAVTMHWHAEKPSFMHRTRIRDAVVRRYCTTTAFGFTQIQMRNEFSLKALELLPTKLDKTRACRSYKGDQQQTITQKLQITEAVSLCILAHGD